jgi:peptide/nickel transport system substrate-binding protein
MFKRQLILLATILLLSGCSGPAMKLSSHDIVLPDPSTADPNGKIIFALGGEPSIINPILSSDSASSGVEGPIFSGIIRINEKLEVVPDLATSWDVSKDGLVWTFHLRHGVKWHDGAEFTAEDVKFTFDSILDPKVNSVRRGDYIIDGNPIVFEAVDRYTVKAILPKPFAPFLISAGMSVIPKHLLQGKDINTADFNRNPVGTGPFKFKEWLSGDHVLLVRNDEYYFGRPKLAEILMKTIPDENSRLIALKAGEIDDSDIPPKDYKSIRSIPGLNVFEYETLVYTYFGFNLKSPLFKDIRVRKALAYATNKDQLIGLVLKGLGKPAYCPTSPVSWSYSDDVAKYPYDPKKAKALLKDAGFDRKPIEFTVLVNQGNKEREKAAIILQQQWKKIGVKMNIRVMEWSAMLKLIQAPKDPKDYDAVIMGWSLGLDPDAWSIWHSKEYPKGLNFVGYNNPEVDRLLSLGRTTMERLKRKEIYAKMNKLISEDQPYIFLWYPKSVVAVRDRVGGLMKDPGPTGPFLYIEDVFVRK